MTNFGLLLPIIAFAAAEEPEFITSFDKNTTSLYASFPHVRELPSDGVEAVQRLPTGAHIVEFYAPSCPHCQEFSHVYARIARRFSLTGTSVKFYAVNCELDEEVVSVAI